MNVPHKLCHVQRYEPEPSGVMRLQLHASFDLFQVCTMYYHNIEIIIWGRLILSFTAYFALFLGDLG